MFKKILYPAIFLIILFSFFNSNVIAQSGWYKQMPPYIGIRNITGICFIDSLMGFATINNLSNNDTGYVLKTTNGGYNWNFRFTALTSFSALDFINANTGYACGGTNGIACLYKTTNSGINWISVNCPLVSEFDDIEALNSDTIFLIEDEFPIQMGLYRTVNGGINWTKYTVGTSPDKIYMFNNSIGFVMCNEPFGEVYKTINGGNNWSLISTPNEGAYDIKFINSFTGWKSWSSKIQKTTNGGLDWIDQTLPSGGGIFTNKIYEISVINKDTLWAVGATKFFPGYGNKGILFRTTNGGTNWHYQVPNLSINFENYYYCQFIGENVGWVYNLLGGIHTISGGDTNFLTPINHHILANAMDFKLHQNYPNPFNPATTISFNIPSKTFVTVKIYNALGKELETLISKELPAGFYEKNWNAENLASGIYYYSVITNKFIDTKKMILLK